MDELQDVLDQLQPEKDFVEPHAGGAAAGRGREGADGRAAGAAGGAERVAARDAAPASPSTRSSSGCARSAAQALAQPDERTVDWATAEELAMASILADGTSIRLTGEDVERGTFSHRHAVLHDVKTGGDPRAAAGAAAGARRLRDPQQPAVGERRVLGFEYGYNVQAPSRLVIWEAQYGDFINGAQVIIDEFITSARVKWGQQPSLVLLLPHAHEGQGPDHASARPERFLQLAADINMRIANCTTAAQYFHLLRRQAALLLTDPLPLIVLTPKSLLRHPLVASTPRELAEGRFRTVIDDDGGARTRGRRAPRPRVQRQGLRGSRRQRQARGGARHGHLSASSSSTRCPAQSLRAMLDGYASARRDRLGPGGAGEHGRVGLHPAAPASRRPAGGRCAPSPARAARARPKGRPRATRASSSS